MLDEPTNHLDIEGVAWLARHLKSRWPATGGGLIVVTHDRWFLDEVCNLTWEARRQNQMRKELAWLRRGAPARTTKPKFRMDAAAELIANEPEPRDRVALSKLATQRLGKDVVDVEDMSYSVGGKELLHDVTWRLGPGDRVGLVGVNGAGKTTLIRCLLGEYTHDGEVAIDGRSPRAERTAVRGKLPMPTL